MPKTHSYANHFGANTFTVDKDRNANKKKLMKMYGVRTWKAARKKWQREDQFRR